MCARSLGRWIRAADGADVKTAAIIASGEHSHHSFEKPKPSISRGTHTLAGLKGAGRDQGLAASYLQVLYEVIDAWKMHGVIGTAPCPLGSVSSLVMPPIACQVTRLPNLTRCSACTTAEHKAADSWAPLHALLSDKATEAVLVSHVEAAVQKPLLVMSHVPHFLRPLVGAAPACV